jgi:hypothetical protein
LLLIHQHIATSRIWQNLSQLALANHFQRPTQLQTR